MYVVICDHPYYPEVYYIEGKLAAMEQAAASLEDMRSVDGAHDCTVTVAEVMTQANCKSDY